MMSYACNLEYDDAMEVCSCRQRDIKKLEKNEGIHDYDDNVDADNYKLGRTHRFKNVLHNRYVWICIIVFICSVGFIYGLRAYSQHIYACYINNKVSYKDTIRRLNTLDRFVDTKWMCEKCTKLKISREVYEEGCNYYENFEWKNAMDCFEKVIPEDTNYNSAQKKIERCKSNYYYPNTDIPTYSSITGIQANTQNHKLTDTMVAYTYNYGDEGDIKKYLEYLKNNCGYTFKGEIVDELPYIEGFYGGNAKIILTGTNTQLIIGITIK